mmetsp:Transcript_4893/g.20015  ORF Transcript_4893/g.20015 Transcript_4893/m.20015 type:complete len:253 (-) Transcript_4893:1186-1944(-)
MRRILSKAMTVWRRCAMARSVASRNSRAMTAWTLASVAASTCAVASSRHTTRDLRRRHRASASNWRCPVERTDASPSLETRSPRWRYDRGRPTASSAAAAAASPNSSNGSRLRFASPARSTASCAMSESRRRSVVTPSVAMSTPSMTTRPAHASTSRNVATRIVDLPAPVRPTTPAFSPGLRANDASRSASGRPGRYLSETASNATAPWAGHAVSCKAASAAGTECGGSRGTRPPPSVASGRYSNSRSSDVA